MMSWEVYTAMVSIAPSPLFSTNKLGVVMEPEPHNPSESGGVLNPAGVTGPDGGFYLFPRRLPADHYSRISTAPILRAALGSSCGAARLGVPSVPQWPNDAVRTGLGR